MTRHLLAVVAAMVCLDFCYAFEDDSEHAHLRKAVASTSINDGGQQAQASLVDTKTTLVDHETASSADEHEASVQQHGEHRDGQQVGYEELIKTNGEKLVANTETTQVDHETTTATDGQSEGAEGLGDERAKDLAAQLLDACSTMEIECCKAAVNSMLASNFMGVARPCDPQAVIRVSVQAVLWKQCTSNGANQVVQKGGSMSVITAAVVPQHINAIPGVVSIHSPFTNLLARRSAFTAQSPQARRPKETNEINVTNDPIAAEPSKSTATTGTSVEAKGLGKEKATELAAQLLNECGKRLLAIGCCQKAVDSMVASNFMGVEPACDPQVSFSYVVAQISTRLTQQCTSNGTNVVIQQVASIMAGSGSGSLGAPPCGRPGRGGSPIHRC